jgi:ATP-dependent Clp protease ATP-binding subunit ClpB
VIQRHLQDPLAQMILSGDVLDGATVVVSSGEDGLMVDGRTMASNRQRPAATVVH